MEWSRGGVGHADDADLADLRRLLPNQIRDNPQDPRHPRAITLLIHL